MDSDGGSAFTADMTVSMRELEWSSEIGLLVFLKLQNGNAEVTQPRSITCISTGLRIIHRTNRSSTDTCKPITSYCNTFHYLPGAELSIATSKLLFKT